ncbi:MAG: hypothetical protein ACM3L6_02955 [Deltaproteobacteria bacterium]
MKSIRAYLAGLCLLSVSSIFVLSQQAFAEAVYLKNGRIMVGRIVEKTPQYIVIKNGEGSEAVTATVFLDDVARVLDDAAYAQEMANVPYYLQKQPLPQASPLPDSVPLQAPTEDQASRIFSLVQSSRALQGTAGRRAQDPFSELSSAGPNPMTLRAYAAYLQMIEERKIELGKLLKAQKQGQGAAQGNGRIAGTVTLPAAPQRVAVSGDASGGLYVYLLKKLEDGRFVFPVPMLYAVVDAANLTLAQVRYEIGPVPEGRYKVFAEWDVAPPAVREEGRGEETFLNYLGAQGDYNGSYDKVLRVGPDEELKGIDFPCDSQAPFEEVFLGWLQPFDFEVSDIYYVRSAQEGPRIVLVVKNTGANPIDKATLDLAINDINMLFPVEIKNIGAGEEKEFDISSFFRTHLEMTEGAHPERKPRMVTFRLDDPLTKEVRFEKSLYIY